MVRARPPLERCLITAVALVSGVLLQGSAMVCPVALADTAWARFRHPSYGFTLSYPQGWEVLSGEGRAAFAAIGPPVAGVPGARLNVAVATARVPANASLEEAEEDLERMLRRPGTAARLLRKDRIDLHGIPAFIAYLARENPQGAGLYQMMLIVAYRGRGYAVVGTTAATSSRLSEETRLLQTVVLTFRPL